MLNFENKERLEKVLTDYVCEGYDPDGATIDTEDMGNALEFLRVLHECPFNYVDVNDDADDADDEETPDSECGDDDKGEALNEEDMKAFNKALAALKLALKELGATLRR